MNLLQNDIGSSSTSMARVYVVILNWNGWRDTIECLESVLRLDYPNYKVVVCDNASSDGSLGHISSWAGGDSLSECPNPDLWFLTKPPIPKPVAFVEVSAWQRPALQEGKVPLLLIQTGENLGFAGGNNVALKYALNQGDCDFAWILNNDTVVRPDALSCLVKHVQAHADAGLVGSKILCYDQPKIVQALGGYSYDPWTARGWPITSEANAIALTEEAVEEKLAYISGAAMFVTRAFLETVGLMQEDYFLYFEELDWARRARSCFALSYCSTSIVYHKEGGSLGSSQTARSRSVTAEYFFTRNRLRFTRRFYPYALPVVVVVICAALLSRVASGLQDNARAVFRGFFSLGLPN